MDVRAPSSGVTSAASSSIAEKLPAVGETDVHAAAGPAERNGLDVLLAVLRPHHAGYDRHRPVERVLGPAGGGVVTDGLPRRPGRDALLMPEGLGRSIPTSSNIRSNGGRPRPSSVMREIRLGPDTLRALATLGA